MASWSDSTPPTSGSWLRMTEGHMESIDLTDGRLCTECGADILGNDPHGPECSKAD